MVQVSQDNEQREATFNITSGVKQPKHVFVYLQRTVTLIFLIHLK